jgi:hypothetical protein
VAGLLVRSIDGHSEQVNLARQASCSGRADNGPVADARVYTDNGRF